MRFSHLLAISLVLALMVLAVVTVAQPAFGQRALGQTAGQISPSTGKAFSKKSGIGLSSLPADARDPILAALEKEGALGPMVANPWAQQDELTSSDGSAGDEFGFSVAVSGSTVVVGAYCHPGSSSYPSCVGPGAAYVFAQSGGTWTQQGELTGSGGGFGYSVAISGSTVVVGAPYQTVGSNEYRGAAYVFVQNGTTWSQQAELNASDGVGGDEFGTSVAVSGSSAVVGAICHPGESTVPFCIGPGAAYVFVQSGTTWTQQQELTASDGAVGDSFGWSVAMSGGTAVVSAYRHMVGSNNFQGAAYVFVENGGTWTQQAELIASDGEAIDYFGWSVAVSGGTAIVGAPYRKIGSNPDQGVAYMFVQSGTTWTQQQELTASDGSFDDEFGTSVAVSGSTAVVGAWGHTVGSNYEQGAAYVFVQSGTTWTQQQELTASDGAAENGFGWGIAVSGGTAVVGAPDRTVGSNAAQGAAYVFGVPVTLTVSVTGSGTVTSNPAGISCPGTCSAQFNTGTVVTLTETPVTGYSFSGWGGCPESDGAVCSVLMNGAVTVTANFNSLPFPQNITFTTPAPVSAEYGSNFTMAATASSGLAVAITTSGSCSGSGISSATITMTSGTGTCSVIANQGGNAQWLPAPPVTAMTTATPAQASVIVASGMSPSIYGQSVTFTATVTSDTGAVKGRRTTKRPRDLNGTVRWSANTGCSATNVSSTPPRVETCTTTLLSGGLDTVTATYTANDGNHTTASGSVSQTVNLAVNTVTFTTPAPSSAEYGSTFTVAATGLGTGAITYTSDGVVCTNSSATYTMIEGSGACTVTATQAADANYNSASASESVTAESAQASVSVSLTSGTNPSTYGQSLTFSAAIGSDTGQVKGRTTSKKPKNLNGSVAWSANTGCTTITVSGNPPQTATCTTSILAGGTVTVTATYTASDSNHTTASGSVSQTVTLANQTVSCTGIPAGAAYNSGFTVSCTCSSGLPAAITTFGSCSGSGLSSATITMTSGTGACEVIASCPGNSNYNPALPVTNTVNATLASQSITVVTSAPPTAVPGSSFTIEANTSSGSPISFAAGPSTVCSLTGATATSATIMIARTARIGTLCTITLTQPGNSYYSAPPPVIGIIRVTVPLTPSVSFISTATSKQYGTTFTVTASSNETGVVSNATITSSTPSICTIGTMATSGTTVTAPVAMLTSSGTCDLAATWAINAVYKGEIRHLAVRAEKATPTVSFTGAPGTATNGATFTVTAASSATTATPAITAAGSCTVDAATNTGSGTYQATVTMTRATGTCTTKAAWAATADYAAASAKQTTYQWPKK